VIELGVWSMDFGFWPLIREFRMAILKKKPVFYRLLGWLIWLFRTGSFRTLGARKLFEIASLARGDRGPAPLAKEHSRSPAFDSRLFGCLYAKKPGFLRGRRRGAGLHIESRSPAFDSRLLYDADAKKPGCLRGRRRGAGCTSKAEARLLTADFCTMRMPKSRAA
jgi:hypothetical protein